MRDHIHVVETAEKIDNINIDNMPYIKKEDREKFGEAIYPILEAFYYDGKGTWDYNKPISPGELNYLISSILWTIFDKNPSYTLGNNIVGMLECVKQEFYRRKLAPYEDEKIVENGDI